MGKTPKDKHGVERRRPYNYPRNAQAQTQNYGIESRNYSYSTGNVQRKIPIYQSVPFSGVSGPLPNQAYRFGSARARGRFRGINKTLKPINRQKRPERHNKQALTPRHKVLTRKTMQAETEGHRTVQDKTQESVEQVIKNGPESCAMPSEDKKMEGKEKIEDKSEEMSNTEACDSNGITIDIGDDTEKEEHKSKSLSNKEKKAKKGSPAAKISPKGKHSPKSKKESKSETDEDPENTETKKEKSHLKKADSELRNKEAQSSDLQPSVTITRMKSIEIDTTTTDDSIIEIPIDNKNNKPQEKALDTGIDENACKIVVEVHNTVKDSPRRSTRRLVRQTPPPKPKISEKFDSSSIIVLDSDDSISVLEVSHTSQERSFAQSLRSMSGRPSLRPLPAYNRSFNRPSYTTASASSRSVTTSNDSESDSQETKLTQPKSSLWGIFRSPTSNTASQDSVTDNEESTNRSYADDSGNDSEATAEPTFEIASNVSFRKRKIDDIEVEEPEQDVKKIREDSEKNYSSSGLLSIVSSPINLFTSKLRGDQSSTPVQLHETSDMNDKDNSIQQDVSEIQYEENISKTLNEKDDMTALSLKIDVEQEPSSRRWCSVM